MMRNWEEKVKPTFGNNTDPGYTYHVLVPGVPDNIKSNVEDSIHYMKP